MVTINGVLSKEENIKYGVPLQESVLRLILFILYIKDLCNIKIDELEVSSYLYW